MGWGRYPAAATVPKMAIFPQSREFRGNRLASASLLRCGGEGDGGLGGQQEKGEALLQIEANDGVGVAQIADREILADMQVEIAAAGGQHKGAGDGRGPDDLGLDQPMEVLDDRIAVIPGLADRGVRLGT